MSMDPSNRRVLLLLADLLALALLFLALELPNRVEWINAQSLRFLPVELMAIGLLLLVPGRWGRAVRTALSLLLALGLVFKVGDLIVYQVFSRQFNPVFDLYLIDDGLRVVIGAFGSWHAVLLVLAVLAIFALIVVLSYVLLERFRHLLSHWPRWSALALAAVLALWLALKLAGVARVNSYFTDVLLDHARAIATSVADMRSFGAVVNADSTTAIGNDRLLAKLRGKDVLVVFVEAYGRTAFDHPEHEGLIRPLLDDANFQLGLNGQQARSAWLTSPTVGGLSWLAHGTLLSGLWINDQPRYDTLLMSQRPTLNKLFQRAGFRTVGVMPQIIQPWPEGKYFGYDQLYPAAELGYQGLPFGWISMPDQYTLAYFQARERSAKSHRNLMAQIVLVSSHTPWAPLPQVIKWSDIKDGHEFDEQTKTGPDVDAVWEDPAKIREQYRTSIAYDLNTLISYAINFGGDDLVMLIVGDHQPLPIASDYSDAREVPVHLIAGDKAVLDAIDDWHWSQGLIPADDAPVWRMDALRDRFIQAFSQP
ncbi:MAG TPA: hypothetical protein VMH83_15985 [Candidatus Acidoferrum sp.]|nr:hypothetical protein [Candidatus Acidoferrum sp.]